MCVKGRNLHVVPVQTRVSEVGLALQERRRPLHPVTEVVVVVTGLSLHDKKHLNDKIELNFFFKITSDLEHVHVFSLHVYELMVEQNSAC